MFRWYLRHGFTPFYYPEGDGGGGPTPEDLRKATFERDSALGKVATLEAAILEMKKQLPTDDEKKRIKELTDAAALLEEDKKKKAGEWETLKTEMATKHAAEVKTLTEQAGSLSALITDGEIARAFANAYVDKAPLFGDDKALTVFTPDIATDAFRKYVNVEMKDGKPILTVKDAAGKVVIDKSGNPAPFGPALLEVINGLPTKDRILRGSGKSGSGNSGGRTDVDPKVDITNPTAAQLQDPKVREAVKARQAAAGGVQMGAAFDKVATTAK